MKLTKVKFSGMAEGEADCPTIVLSGECAKSLQTMIGTCGIDQTVILPIASQEELEKFIDNYVVFVCDGFLPTEECIRNNPEILFISTEYVCSASNVYYAVLTDDNLPYNLADFTGLTVMRNLRWEPTLKLWWLHGIAHSVNKHSHIKLAARFTMEMIKWIAAGRPLRSEESVAILFDKLCSRCSEFVANTNNPQAGSCNLCGCGIMRVSPKKRFLNKLSVSTASCAADPPKFSALTTITADQIRGREAELQAKYVKQMGYATGQIKGCHCVR